jgi:hypothetical protein
MHFLIMFGLMLVFGWAFPSLFKIFYWLLILTIFSVGPGSFLYLGCLLFGAKLDYAACCMLCLVFIGLPFTYFTSPSKSSE